MKTPFIEALSMIGMYHGYIVSSLSVFCMDLIPCSYEIKCSDNCDVFVKLQEAT